LERIILNLKIIITIIICRHQANKKCANHSGAFSEVKKAINRETGAAVAIKIIDRAKCAGKEGMISSEIAILKKVEHENIIQLYELFETEAKIYLVMEM
jgi:serine/threonine protein kinase